MYTDADKVRELMKKLSFQINDAKAKSLPGSTSLSLAQKTELNSLFEQILKCLFYQNVQTKIQCQIDAGESPDADPLFLG